MPPVTLAQVARLTERLYKPGIYRIGLSAECPLWALIPKFGDFFERTYTLRNRYGKNPSGSASFAISRSTAGPSPYGSFELTRVHDYITVQLDNETMRAMSRNMERLVTYVKEECDSAFERAHQRISHNLYRNHGGSVAQLIAAGAGGGTQTITVRDPASLINVFPGMYLGTSPTDGTSGAYDNNPQIVTALNRETGTITTSAVTWDDDGGFADGDHLIPDGDFGLKMSGLAAWVPESDPSDTFFGMERGNDPVYLGGIRYVAQPGSPDGTIVRTLVNAAGRGMKHGAKISHIMMHPEDYAAYLNEVNQKVEIQVMAHIGFSDPANTKPIYVDVGIVGVRQMLPTGPAVVVPDPQCPKNIFWMLDMRTWGYYGLDGTGPDWLVPDGGQRFQRMVYDDLDAAEAQIGWYGQIGCTAPGCNIRVNATNVLPQ